MTGNVYQVLFVTGNRRRKVFVKSACSEVAVLERLAREALKSWTVLPVEDWDLVTIWHEVSGRIIYQRGHAGDRAMGGAGR